MSPFRRFRHIDESWLLLPGITVGRLGGLLRGIDGTLQLGGSNWSDTFFLGRHGGVERDVAWKEGEVSGSKSLGYGILAAGAAGGSALAAGVGASGDIRIGPGGLVAEGRGNAEANLVEGHANGRIGNDTFGASGGVQGSVGAHASAEGGVSVGPNGAGVNAGASAFAGVEASANASVELAGVKPEVKASVSAGLGVHANVDAHIGVDKVKASVDLGATFGLGGSVKVDIEVDPAKVAGSVSSAWQNINPFD